MVTLYGTVSYFSEKLMSVVMNRLVVNNGFSLEQSFDKLKEEITIMNEPPNIKELYYQNLEKAYGKITDSIYGIDEELEII